MNGSGLQVTITVNAAGAVATATPVANTGTGYITGDRVMGNGGSQPCILTITSNAANDKLWLTLTKQHSWMMPEPDVL